jgi:hypothetical protein
MLKTYNFKQKLFSKYYYLILIASILVCSPLYVKGLYHGHDINDHVFRVIGTVLALKGGQLPPSVGPNLAGNFGYAWNIFYAPLSAYIPAIIKIFLPTFIGSLKVFLFLTVFVSGLTMYHFAKDYTKSQNVGVLASLIYITAPYRIVDMFVRGAVGEVLAFVFIPLLFHGLYNLLRSDGTKSYLITIGGAGLVLSHNISAFICAIMAILYLILNYKSLAKLRVIGGLIANGLFIVGITLFFIVPLLEQRIYGNYVVFLPDRMGSIKSMRENSVYIHQLLFGKFELGGSYGLDTITNEFPFTIGLEIVLPLLLTPFVYGKIKEEKYHYIVLIILGIFAAFTTSDLFPWLSMPKVFAYIQFPWRILMLSIFFLSIVASQNLSLLFNKFEIKHIAIILLIIFVYISPLISLTDNDPTISDKTYLDTSINESNAQASGDRAFNEYLPLNTFHNLDYLIKRSKKTIRKSGDAKIYNEVDQQGNITFSFNNSKLSVVELPLLYYVGYSGELIDGAKKTKINTYETDKGFVGLTLPANSKGEIHVKFTGTAKARVSYIISLVTSILFIIVVVGNHFRFKHKKGAA